MVTTPRHRSGCQAAVISAVQLLAQIPASTARSTPAASMTAMVSATSSVSAYEAPDRGRSERPLPRGSTVITRYSRARYGTWAFQAREWTRGSIGTKTRDGPPEPNTS